MTVKLYTLPNCGQCIATKSDLKRQGIDFEVVEMDKDEEAYAKVIGLGYSAAPVVVVEKEGLETHWSGFKPQNIKALAA